MRKRVRNRVRAAAFVTVVFAMLTDCTAAPVWAAPSAAPSSAAPSSGTGSEMCTIRDSRVTEVSGMVATPTGYVVVNDSNLDRSRVKIFTLDKGCKLINTMPYPSTARDPEDLAMARDGTLWVADIGDNSVLSGGSGERRSSIALWSLGPTAREPVIHRLVYPDGQPRDAETLLIDGNGNPVIVTKEPAGEVYVLDEPLQDRNTTGTRLKRAGTFKTSATGTDNPLGFIGVGLVTGGAVAPDGTRAVVRTLSDAYEFDVTGGDVVGAITTGTPRITPLPNEPQGESIAYTPDGRWFLTASDQPGASKILRYTPAGAGHVSASATPSAKPGAVVPTQRAVRSTASSLSLRDIRYLLGAVVVAGVLFVVLGILGIRRSRRLRSSP